MPGARADKVAGMAWPALFPCGPTAYRQTVPNIRSRACPQPIPPDAPYARFGVISNVRRRGCGLGRHLVGTESAADSWAIFTLTGIRPVIGISK